MERDCGMTGHFVQLANFNSHAHVERDQVKWLNTIFVNAISTHTLTWSVTSGVSVSLSRSPISTHTLTWSVTSSGVALYSLSKISTHTLTWSVTNQVADAMIAAIISTHTLTWSVTAQTVECHFVTAFQLTRSRGA